jgi:hypothetical protein
MATVVKNFRIKSGLVVEGTSGTIDGHNILTESTSGDQYILNLVGGATLVKSVGSNLSVDNAGQLSLDLAGISSDIAGTRLYADGSSINVDVEGIADDLIGSFGIATTTDVNNAISTASTDATNKANAALSDAQSFATTAANNAQSAAEATASSDATSKANAAQSAAESFATTAANNAQSAAEDYADNKINDASNATDKVWSAYKTSTEIGLAQAAAEQHADDAIANLVGLAPSTLDTIEELATALENNPDIIANLESVAAGKQDTLTPGNGIVIDENLIYVPTFLGSGVSVTPTAVEIDRTVVDEWYDAAGAASSAQTAAQNYADGLASNYDAAGSASAAQSAAETTAQNALNDVLSGATQFTEVAVDWMVKHVAGYSYANNTEQVAYAWNKNKGASAKFLVRLKNGVHSQVSEVLVTRDDSDNLAITEYGIVTSNGILGDITVGMYNNDIQLKVTPAHNTGTEIFVSGTLMAYTD